MAIVMKQLAGGTITNAAATYYTAAAAVKARIDAFTVTNYSGSAATITIWLVPSGGSAADTNIIVKTRSIAAGASGRILEAIGQTLEGGGTLQMQASANSAITVAVSGVEQTAL